ncbi:DEAD/DEAH box helicase [Candidatus Cloacimonadota bacterium]
MNINEFLTDLLRKNYFRNNIVKHYIEDPRPARFGDIPEHLAKPLKQLLISNNIGKLYTHQEEAVEAVLQGKNLVVSTGVASGKSLCYILPMLNEFLNDPETCGLLLFPTKALTQDQMNSFNGLLQQLEATKRTSVMGIYDGDTSRDARQQIRQNVNFVMTNPDMLHLGILPHHTKWARFMQNLKFIVIDEVHIYRGIFGSHFCNVLRRLKRIARYYGADPQFILTSATLYNVKEFISRLLEEDFHLIADNGAPTGEKHFIIYNPPVIDPQLGLRKSSLQESVLLANKFLENNLQTLLFAHTRRKVELILSYLRSDRHASERIFGYRSGYLPAERRAIEKKFKQADINVLVATNAMELGIDIGSLDAVIITGYPGSISSTRQQSGRAGRKGSASITIFVATANLIDQFLVQHPEYLIDSNPEEALIDPDNPYLLLNHLKCALFEKPFSSLEAYGDLSRQQLSEYLELLKKYGMLHQSGEKMFWKGDTYPADSISLRSAGTSGYLLKCDGEIIGTVDENSAFWMTHPEAIYLHGGESYFVQQLDREKHIVQLVPLKTEFYTQSQAKTEFQLIELTKQEELDNINRFSGNLNVISQVTGYKKMKWFSNEILGYGEVDLPPTEYVTSGSWFSMKKDLIEKMVAQELWNNARNDYGPGWDTLADKIRARDDHVCTHCGTAEDQDRKLDVHHKVPFRQFSDPVKANAEENLITLCPSCHKKIEKQHHVQSGLAGLTYLLLNLAPVFLMCDRTDIRAHYESSSKLADNDPAVIFYDSVPGGIGLSDKLYTILDQVLKEGWDLVRNCSCDNGCPACTGPVAEYGEGAKHIVENMLRLILVRS